jgi:hypothetical protein
MAHNGVENRCVPAEAFRIHVRGRVHVGAMREQQLENLLLIEIDGQVQQRRAIDRRPVHPGTAVLRATELRWINLEEARPSLDQSRIATQEILEPSQVPPMKCHHRRVGQFVTLPLKNLEHGVFPIWVASVRLQRQGQRREPVPFGIGERRSQLCKETKPGRIQCLAWAHDQARLQLRAVRMQPARAFELPLEQGSIECVLVIACAE